MQFYKFYEQQSLAAATDCSHSSRLHTNHKAATVKTSRMVFKMASNCRLFVSDKHHGIQFLVDSGADVSIIPATRQDMKRIPSTCKLYAANGTPINMYGEKLLQLDLGFRRSFKWPFIVANTDKSILGADFLKNFGLLVDLKRRRLIDMSTQI